MAESFYAGTTSQTIDIFIGDSSSLVSAGLAGLVYNTSGLTCYYRKGATGTATAVTLATQTVGGAWSSGGFVEINATFMKGMYRFDIPNAAIDTAGIVHIVFSGVGSMRPVTVRIDCRAVPSDIKTIATQTASASGTVTFPNATLASTTNITAGSLTTVATLTGHTPQTGDSFARIGATGSGLTSLAPASTALSSATWTPTKAGYLDTAISSRMATYTQPIGFLTATFPTTVASTTNISAATGVTLAAVTHTGAVIPTVTTLTGHTPQTGDSYPTIATLSVPTAAAIADAVWDEARTGHDTTGTFGESAAQLALSAGVIIPGTVSTAVLSPTTSAFAVDDITEATADHYLGRSLIFTSGALLGQATRITGYSLVSAEGNFAVVALTEAPANNDTFIIV